MFMEPLHNASHTNGNVTVYIHCLHLSSWTPTDEPGLLQSHKVIQCFCFSSVREPAATPKPSKRLTIVAECRWRSDADRDRMLKKLCEAMAQDRLNEPFWFRRYLVSPVSQTVEESNGERCIQYKIHISQPKLGRQKPEQQQDGQTGTKPRREVV